MNAPTGPGIEVSRPRAGVAHVVLSGEFDLSTSRQLVYTFKSVLPTCARLVVDLSDVEFLDSITIHTLVDAAKAAEAAGVAFAVVIAEASIVERVLEVTGLMEILHRVHALDEALVA